MLALGLYTALPGFARWDEESQGLLAAMLPLVGLVLGFVWWGLAAFARHVLPGLVGAVLVALAMPVLTGFLHLDGYMDVADAVLSSRPREEKLRILKDPHTGAFAVIALLCLLLLQTAAASEALTGGKPMVALVFLPIVSRALAGFAIMTFPPLPGSQYGRLNYDTATSGKRLFCLFCAGIAILAAFLAGWRVGVACAAAVVGFVLVCWRAIRALGGMNGDISGCAICCAELCGLVALACF